MSWHSRSSAIEHLHVLFILSSFAIDQLIRLSKMLLTNTARPRCLHCALRQQIRHATLIRRPKRPYTFTQLITLSDGSTFTHRTTSPQPIYRSTKDTKNSPLWNPSSQKLLNIEEDEAGRLRRFRKRFGRGFDVEAAASEESGEVSIAQASSPLFQPFRAHVIVAAIADRPYRAQRQPTAHRRSRRTRICWI